MQHEAAIRDLLDAGRPGDALVYLARALDALVELRAGARVDPWHPTDAPVDVYRRAPEPLRYTSTGSAVISPGSTVIPGEDTTTFVLVPGREEQLRELAERLGLGVPGWDPDRPACGSGVEDFVLGGPMWLSTFRTFVEGLPRSFKRDLVQEALHHSNQDAADLGAYLLKQEDGLGHAAQAAETLAGKR